MFHLNEFHHLGFIAVIFHHQGSYRVGDHHCLTLHKDAVTRDGIDFPGAFHLLTDLFMATGGADNQLRPCPDTFGNGIVSGCVARMKGNQHIQLFRLKCLDATLHKLQTLQT